MAATCDKKAERGATKDWQTKNKQLEEHLQLIR